ncbi:hybrid sensor histidine kinase/response regulator transcription factor [Larkinella rosea]|uniref:histidine kinase n=1 Tax=Larkinella rosea TaxID=2025312 RepID=A0A3P1BAG4_9BACT|nr:ATP-binding protein [Larkinella rosea]RRA98070.1 hybrid sensor histidine kinase/response regulator [Larkinella rosea]
MKQRYSQLLWLVWGWLFSPCSVLLAQPKTLPRPELITDQQGLPQSFVPSIVQDKQGFIWMATRDGLARYDGSQFKVFQPDPNGRPSLSTAEVAQIQVDKHGKLWISNELNDLDVFDPVTEQFTNFSKQSDFKSFKSKDLLVSRYYVDRHDQLWKTSANDGLICLDLRTKRVQHFRHDPQQPQSLSNNFVIGIREDRAGNLWVITVTGLDRIDWKTHAIRHYLHQQVLESSTTGVWVCKSGDVVMTTERWLWVVKPASGQIRKYPIPAIATPDGYVHFTEDSHGNLYFARHSALFRFIDQQGVQLLDEGGDQSQNSYQVAFIDQSDVLWVGTSGMGVRKYDLRNHPFKTAPYQTEFVPDLLSPNWLGGALQPGFSGKIKLTSYNFRYTFDQRGRLWYNMGSSDLYRIDFQKKKTDPISFPRHFANPVIGFHTCPLATDPSGRVWAVYDTTAFWYDEQQTQWRTFPYPIPHPLLNAHQMLVVDDQALWLATSSGGLLRIDRSSGRIKKYNQIRNNPVSLSSNALLCLASDPTNPDLLWIGTFGSGVCIFNKKTGLSKRLSVADGLPNNVIYSVIPDSHGDVWAGTNKGLGRINRRTLKIQTYTTKDGLLANEFNRFHFLHMPRQGTAADDHILMGGLEGITAFKPGEIRPDSFQPVTEITSLFINNKPVVPGLNSPLGESPIQAIHELRLPYNQNFLTIEFAVLQFNKREKNRFRYQLEGLDPGWVESRRPEAVFTDLRPGTYTLRLNATNLTGVWSSKIRILKIIIHPPWWATWWAYAFYALVVIWISYGLFQNYVNQLKMQQSIALRDHEAAKLRELDAMKTRFFANVTHEFRTPLTLILSPAEQLLQQPLEADIQRRISIMETQARHLLRLINQLMDFSKLEASLMTLNESLGDLGQCVDQWLVPFREQAAGLGIELAFENRLASHYWFDAGKLEPIIYNLVSNALKFTPKGGYVWVRIQPLDEKNGVELVVKDTGIGIPAVSLPLIFNRYYQVETGTEYIPSRPSGTGIGLSLVKELVECQQGEIAVESQTGQGTLFRVWLPVRVAQPAEKSRLGVELPMAIFKEEVGDERVRILLVEDNAELAQFITESLPFWYEFDLAHNGLEGLTMALEHMPDVVISDVMMPVMDGYTLCNNLKSDQRTSHIPVVLLTAKVSYEDRIEGLTRGADEYLTKPFHVQELQLRVRNLLENQRRLREQLHTELLQPGLPQPVQNQAPASVDPLLAGITELIESNLDNAAFRVEDIEKFTNMSRMSLYRKMKVVTGMTPGDFIRVYRLKRSVQLLKEGKAISETAYLVGFDSPAHFTKMFRQHYQVSPRQYLANAK